MSGGHFDYIQYNIGNVVEEVKQVMVDEYSEEYSEETLAEFETCAKLLELASIYLQRVDWLVSGDDGEVSFHQRLREDLEKCGISSQILISVPANS